MTTSRTGSRPAAEATADTQRRLQRDQDARDRAAPGARGPAARAQAPDPRQPRGQPPQHVPKPGRESALVPLPQFSAPDYRGSDKLAGSVALITGGDSGIGRAVAVL